MSNPNSNSAASLSARADELAQAAAIAKVAEADAGRLALRNAYQVVANVNVQASVSCSKGVKESIIDFVQRCDGIISAGSSLLMAIPLPLLPNEITIYQRQRTYNWGLIANALAAQEQLHDKCFNGAKATANDIVAAAWLDAVPRGPNSNAGQMIMGAEQEKCLAVINTAFASGAGAPGQVAQRILSQAQADNDYPMLSTLLGDPAKRLLAAVGVSRADLVHQYAAPLVQALKGNASPQDASKQVVGGQFLLLQDGSQALNKLPDLADAYYKAMLARANELLDNTTVQSNMQGR